MKIRTAEQYLARYRRRGQAPKTRRSDRRMTTVIWPEDDYAYRSKPNHAARTVALPLRPLGPAQRPVQPEHPRTMPLSTADRRDRYLRQTVYLTARQARRLRKKLRKGAS